MIEEITVRQTAEETTSVIPSVFIVLFSGRAPA